MRTILLTILSVVVSLRDLHTLGVDNWQIIAEEQT